MDFKTAGQVLHLGEKPKQWASIDARREAAEGIKSGDGPTLVFETTRDKYAEQGVPITTLRKARQPGRNTVSPEMDKLRLLKRTYEAFVAPTSSVPGYIQVRRYAQASGFNMHTIRFFLPEF